MTSLQELKLSRILSFRDRSRECTVPLVPPFWCSSFKLSGTCDRQVPVKWYKQNVTHVGSDNQALRLNRYTKNRIFRKAWRRFFQLQPIAFLSPSVSEPNYDSSDGSSRAVCRNNTVSFSDFSDINYWCISPSEASTFPRRPGSSAGIRHWLLHIACWRAHMHVDRPTTSLSLHFRHWEYRMWK